MDTVKGQLNDTAGDAMRLTIDLRNVFPQTNRVRGACCTLLHYFLSLFFEYNPAVYTNSNSVRLARVFVAGTGAPPCSSVSAEHQCRVRGLQVDVTMWGSRLWSCASHSGTEQDCRRRVELLGPSDFSDAMVSFLRQESARIFVRRVCTFQIV